MRNVMILGYFSWLFRNNFVFLHYEVQILWNMHFKQITLHLFLHFLFFFLDI